MSFFAEYIKTLKGVEVEDLLDLVFYRPIGYAVVKLIAPTSITPNQVTLASVVCGLAGAACMARGTPTALALGGCLCAVYNILDCSDGQLARLKGTGTPLGRIIDGAGDYLVTIAVFVGMGIGLAHTAPEPLLSWLLVVAAGLTSAFLSILVDYYRTRFLDMSREKQSILDEAQVRFAADYEAMRGTGRWTFDRFFVGCYLLYCRVQRKLTGGLRGPAAAWRPDPEMYHNRNRVMIRLWTLIGPTMQLSFLIVSSFLNRLDIYLWGTLLAGNFLAGAFLLLQRRIDRDLHSGAEA